MRLRRTGNPAPAERLAKEPARCDGSSSFLSLWASTFAGIALVLLATVCAIVYLWLDREGAYGALQLKSESTSLAGDLSRRAAALQGELREWSDDPELREALRSDDTEVLRSREKELARLIPGALRVRLFPQGSEETGGSGSEALSYAGLDLIHRAERERRVTDLEVHKLAQPDVHLAMAGPVLDQDGAYVLGVAHVALPLSLLPATADAGGSRGRIFFQQQAGDQVVTLDLERGGSLEMPQPQERVEVPGTNLQIAAWPNPGTLLDGRHLLYAVGCYLGSLTLAGIAIWLPLRRAEQALAADSASLVALVEDAASRRPLRGVRFRFSATRNVAERLSRVLRDLGPQPGRSPVAPAPAGGSPSANAALPGRTVGVEVEELADVSVTRGVGDGPPVQVPDEIFRAYDIRGVVGLDLSPELVAEVGRAVATEASAAGDKTVVVARDTRPSSVDLLQALIRGLRMAGCDVLDLGVAPTPLLYYATCHQDATSGVMITGSHNPAQYNGLKVVIGGQALGGERIKALRERILSGALAKGNGEYRKGDLIRTYLDQVHQDVVMARPLKLVIDCGNAAASVVAPDLYRLLGCDLIELNCEPEAGFPEGRVPDPSRPECLEPLQQRVVAEGADLGLAFDGDGDRLGVVDSAGKIIWSDRVLMLLAADVLSRHPGTDVVFDVKCSHHLPGEILRNGGRPLMWRSGHSPLKAKLRETGALLAGEWSGHILFQERWYGFDDALYAGARLLEVLALDPRSSAEVFGALPESACSTPELFLPLAEGEPGRLMAEVLRCAGRLEGVEMHTVDGLRMEVAHGWGLVRASNTQPVLMFRFEADDEETMAEIQGLMRRLMEQAAPNLELPF